jgi:hypothetical protein
MLHPRDRYRREPNNICLEITISLIAAIIMILISIGLVMALTHVTSKNDDTKQMTSEHSAHNKTLTFQKENVTFFPVVPNTQKTVPINLIEVGRKGSVTRTSTVESRHSLARKGRYMRRVLFKYYQDD